MCPLGESCPGDMRPRWPISATKTTTTLGDNCPFAHTYLELKFQQEELEKVKILKQQYKNASSLMNEMINRKGWNPGGAKLTYCNGGCPKIIPMGKSKNPQFLKGKC